jgi:hypothetical protein
LSHHYKAKTSYIANQVFQSQLHQHHKLHKQLQISTIMGPIKSLIQMGGAYAMLNTAMKGLNNKNGDNNSGRGDAGMGPSQYNQQYQPHPQQAPRQYMGQDGFVHVDYCNGACGGRCSGQNVSRNLSPSPRAGADDSLPKYEQQGKY